MNPLYGMKLYYVELSVKTQTRLKGELNGSVYPNIYLGINY